MFILPSNTLQKFSKKRHNISVFVDSLPYLTTQSLLSSLSTTHQRIIQHTMKQDIEQKQITALAAYYNVLQSGLTETKLHTIKQWKEAYYTDEECKLIKDIITKPAMNTQDLCSKLFLLTTSAYK